MDSMRSLNTSLPRARRRQPTPQPDTHQAFRSAALTVTNLYKNALADIDRARSDGYQDALEDLVGFLDKENIGLDDGEGWRIRQWIAERLDGAHGTLPVHSTSDSDEEEDKRARSSSPIMERNSSPEDTRAVERVAEPAIRCDSAPPLVAAEPSPDAEMTPLPTMFHFSSPQTYPSNAVAEPTSYDLPAAARRAFPAPRRPNHRSSSRNLQRAAAQNIVSLGSGAGQKRKLMQDFFNVDFNNDRRDGPGGGGGKRGRMS
ncbi:hypothetical protein CC80DRAFT_490798 [Byssothecium circinans]|uniref:Uncharacterized protein n=1 Tax=Byssothecium circinans TaxID=147558 RepID=A0A6A5TZ46_9PLEO|nr:hypothetical protein CC80DRAFT_490798 [Byssothecium circinans]